MLEQISRQESLSADRQILDVGCTVGSHHEFHIAVGRLAQNVAFTRGLRLDYVHNVRPVSVYLRVTGLARVDVERWCVYRLLHHVVLK